MGLRRMVLGLRRRVPGRREIPCGAGRSRIREAAVQGVWGAGAPQEKFLSVLIYATILLAQVLKPKHTKTLAFD